MAKSNSSKFVYETDNGKIIAKKFESVITAGFLRKHRNSNELDQAMALAELAMDDDSLAVFDEMTPAELGDFYTAWQEDSGVTAGE